MELAEHAPISACVRHQQHQSLDMIVGHLASDTPVERLKVVEDRLGLQLAGLVRERELTVPRAPSVVIVEGHLGTHLDGRVQAGLEP